MCIINRILNFFITVCILLFITACGSEDYFSDVCIASDNFGQRVQVTRKVQSSDYLWTPAVKLKENAPVNYYVTQSINLCAASYKDPELHTVEYDVNASIAWQKIPDFELQTGDMLNVVVEGGGYGIDNNSGSSGFQCNSQERSSTGPYSKSRFNNGCVAELGRGLFMYIGSSPPTHPVNRNFGYQSVPGSPTTTPANNFDRSDFTGLEDDTLFELYDYQIDHGQHTIINSKVHEAGHVYVTLYKPDGHSIRSASGTKPYKLTLRRACPGQHGRYLVGYIQEEGEPQPSHNHNTSASGVTIPITDPEYTPDAFTSDLLDDSNYINFDELSTTTNPETGRYGSGFFTAPKSGNLWLKIFDDTDIQWYDIASPLNFKTDNDYSNNFGSYNVNITTTLDIILTDDQKVINKVVQPFKEMLVGVKNDEGEVPGLIETTFKGFFTKAKYNAQTKQTTYSDTDFIGAVRAAMVLAIVLFGFAFLMGMIDMTARTFIIFMLKIAIIQQLISADSWNFFYDYFFVFFIEGLDDLIRLFTGEILVVFDSGLSGSADPTRDIFHVMDLILVRFLTPESNSKLVALLSWRSFPLGPVYFIMIFVGIFIFFMAFTKAVLVYLLALMGIFFLTALAPIYIVFFLFNKTAKFFDAWWRNMLSFVAQPVLLFAVLVIFAVVIFNIFYSLLFYAVCWDCQIWIHMPFSDIANWAADKATFGTLGDNFFGDFDKFCLYYSYSPWGLDGASSFQDSLERTPIGLFQVFIFIIVTYTLFKLSDWATGLGTAITTGSGGADLGAQATVAMASGAKQGAQLLKSSAGAVKGELKAARFGLKAARKGVGLPLKGADKALEKMTTKYAKEKGPGGKWQYARDAKGKKIALSGWGAKKRAMRDTKDKAIFTAKDKTIGAAGRAADRAYDKTLGAAGRKVSAAGRAVGDAASSATDATVGRAGRAIGRGASQAADATVGRAGRYASGKAAEAKESFASSNVGQKLQSMKDSHRTNVEAKQAKRDERAQARAEQQEKARRPEYERQAMDELYKAFGVSSLDELERDFGIKLDRGERED